MLLDSGYVKQYSAGVAASLALLVSGTCFGWVAPILGYLLSPESEIPMTSSESSWMISIIELGNLISPVPAGILSNKWGRKPLILVTGPMYFFSWILILFYKSIYVMCLARVIQGVAMGIVLTVVPLYMSEIASPNCRGSISSLFHNAWYLGHLIEYSIGPYVHYRTFTYITSVFPLITTIVFAFQPESPYYYLMHGNVSKAAGSLARLRGQSHEKVNNELQTLTDTVINETKNKPTLTDVIRTAADRKSLYIVLILGGIRILSGSIAIMTYSSRTFAIISKSYFSPDQTTIIFGAVMFICSFFSTVVSDISGRRPLLIISSIGSGLCLFTVGTYFFLYTNTEYRVSDYSLVPAVAFNMNSLFLTLGLGPVSVMYQSELFLSNTRGVASSISAINITVWAFVTLKFYQVVADYIGVYLMYWMFSSVCFVGVVIIYFIAPETKGQTFSQIRQEMHAEIENKKQAKYVTKSKQNNICKNECN